MITRPGFGLALLPVLVAGCAGLETRDRSNAVGEIISKARDNGAYKCAPKELALAEAHLQRTRDELDLGNLLPAREHLQIADDNARLAYRKSESGKCGGDRDGDGIPDSIDKCPDQPEDKDGFEDEDGCPDLDNDKDGIPDSKDQCPNEPEDKDNYQDEDGCPDVDNDNDGIADAADKCPNEPEDVDGFQDEDGCPDPDNDNDTVPDVTDKCPNDPGPPENDGCPKKYNLVNVTRDKIELKQAVFFATDRSKILPRSFPLLNDVAQVLKDRPTMSVRIEGHTDIRGSHAHNVKLSRGRAASVRMHLVKLGIASDRMEAVGFGPDHPIGDNRTRAGRAMNRRVEFFITKQ